ncbi:helix-turn-helix transcriptional regulator [Nonomuraea sp. NPDC050556]|uniref:helix-turn-helix transcriptional regulator n=1 Tax=Nonomuraea sp. NPDC050556 TaxID=3364369 RepID=UPI0037A77240
MANTSGRMLRLLSLLQNHRHWPGAELCERLGVSERTLRRDIDRLRELGYPVDAHRGVAGGYQLRSGTAMPPLLLDDDEAVAIAASLLSTVEETSLGALTKVVQVMPPRLRRRVDALRLATSTSAPQTASVDASTLTTIAQACRDAERLTFTYSERPRTVEPHRLVSLKRRWYLVGWDLDRADWRIFRLDRLTGPSTTGTRFRPRDLPDAAAFVESRFGSRATRWSIILRMRAPAPSVERVVAVTGGRVAPVDAETCDLHLDVDDFDWPTLVLAAVGADFEVLQPEEFRAYLRDLGGRFLRA